MKISLTGIRSTGRLHIGNLLSIFSNLHDVENLYLMVADLHGLIDGSHTKNKSLKMMLSLIGIIYFFKLEEKVLPFIQSQNPNHLKVNWFLSTIVPLGTLNTIVTIKKREVTLAKMTYPVLMAADIMLYRPDKVPVGADQRQHIEFYNFLMKKINRLGNLGLGNLELVPLNIEEAQLKIMDLRDPSQKMSKSSLNERGIIFIDDNPLDIRNKFKKSLSTNEKINWEEPNTKNLISIVRLLWPEGIRLLSTVKGKKHFIFKAFVGLGISRKLELLSQRIDKVSDRERNKWLIVGTKRAVKRSESISKALEKVFMIDYDTFRRTVS